MNRSTINVINSSASVLLLVIFLLIYVLGSVNAGVEQPDSLRPAPVASDNVIVEFGEVDLFFNGGTVAMSQITLTAFIDRPLMFCTASNQSAAGVPVACQALNTQYGGVSAELNQPIEGSITVQWLAVSYITPLSANEGDR